MDAFATETQYIGESGQKRILRRILTPQAISILAEAGHLNP
jgi:negative regulator of replication initiation